MWFSLIYPSIGFLLTWRTVSEIADWEKQQAKNYLSCVNKQLEQGKSPQQVKPLCTSVIKAKSPIGFWSNLLLLYSTIGFGYFVYKLNKGD